MKTEELTKILEAHKLWMDSGGKNGAPANLRWTNLREADLSDANLRGADLMGADLSCANLSGANLRDADLYEADLREANLSGADLYEADLYEADLREANLSGADLSGADLSGADLYEADLSEAEVSPGWKIVREEVCERIAELSQRLADRETELASIRMHLGGHPESRLDGPDGLAQATYSAVEIERARADHAEERVAWLSHRLHAAEQQLRTTKKTT